MIKKRELQKAISSKISVIAVAEVGKNTLLNSILMIFLSKIRVICCAPTGRPQKECRKVQGLSQKQFMNYFNTIQELFYFIILINSLDCDVLIIDESSMIDLQLCNSLMEAIPLHTGIVFVGDIDQLPSVGPGKVLNDIIESEI